MSGGGGVGEVVGGSRVGCGWQGQVAGWGSWLGRGLVGGYVSKRAPPKVRSYFAHPNNRPWEDDIITAGEQ